jgi:predicted metalloprotease with PDZ domain
MFMRFRIPIAAILILLAAAVFAGEEKEKKCNASSHECERQIREMLAGRRYLGVTFVDLNPGLGVKAVAANGPADRAGILVGDRILAINQQWTKTATVRDFKQMMAKVLSAGKVTLLIGRSGSFRRIEVKLEPYTAAQIDKIVAAHMSAYVHSDPPGTQP